MPTWKAWLGIAVLAFLGGLLLWWGLVIVVRCERVQPGRVDATIERRFLGWLPLGRETVVDVVKADVYVVWARTSSGGKQRRGSTAALELTSRQGVVTRRTQFGPAFGTRPADMVDQIEQLLQIPSTPTLAMWWMPWLVNLAAVPFVLIVAAVVGETTLRALGLMKPSPPSRMKKHA
jgi:hypothetical protein